MGLFSSKKNKGVDANDTDTQAVDTAPAKSKKRKAKDTMAGLISESVPESALEIMRANEAFIADRDGVDVYVGMLLKAEDIGGLSKKQAARNEDKGTIVELINSGSIGAYVPESLLEAEQMVIMPSATTLDSMDEFPLLTETAKYTVAIVDEQGGVESTDIAIAYDNAVAIQNGDEDVMDFLAANGIEWAAEQEVEEVDNSSDITAVLPAIEDDEDDFMPDDDEDVILEDADEDVFTDELPADDGIGQDDEYDDSYDESPIGYDDEAGVDDDYQEEEEYVEEEVVDEETVSRAVNFRFYSDELGLEVNGDPFDAQFMVENPYVPFNENRGEGWLNQYLNEMSVDANLFMKRLHQDNLLRLREKYYSLISLHCETIQRELDPSNPETQYGRMSDAINENYVGQKKGVAEIVGRRRQEMADNWDSMLKQVGEDASHAAQQQYRERYGRQHSDEMMRVEVDVINSIEAERQSNVRDMNAERRAEAARRLDYGIIETLKTLSDEYRTMLDEETAKYQEWRNRISEFLDEHRKDDVAHTQALAEELAQSQKADRVLQEYTAKLEAAKESYEQSRSVMKADIEHIQRENEERIRDKKAECDSRVAEMQGRLDEQQRKFDDLLEKYAQLDEAKAAEFHSRLAEANDQKAAWQSKCDDIVATHKRTNVIMIALCIVIAIASACVGAFVGTQLNLSFGSDAASTKIEQEFNERMDSIEEKQSSSESSGKTKSSGSASDSSDSSSSETETSSESSTESE